MDFTTKNRRIDDSYRVFHIYQHLSAPMKNLLAQRKYYRKYMKLIGEALYDTGLVLFAFALLPNHTHFLARNAKREQMQSFMRKVNIGFCKYVRSEFKKEGRSESLPDNLFSSQPQYKPVPDYRQFCNILRYIHFNPLKWNSEEGQETLLKLTAKNTYEACFNYALEFKSGEMLNTAVVLVDFFTAGTAKSMLDALNSNDYEWKRFCTRAKEVLGRKRLEEFFGTK